LQTGPANPANRVLRPEMRSAVRTHYTFAMLYRFWLFFAQACTLCVAALFVVSTLRPDLVPRLTGRVGNVIVTQETTTPVVVSKVASYADAAKKAMPAVVNIYTSKDVRTRNPLADDPLFRRYFPDLGTTQRQTSLGSGVIVSKEGYVITNHRVIQSADDIQLVLSDGRRFSAKVRGTDPESDIAVLKADADGLPAITLGHAEDLQVGDVVLAIGNPFGFGNTVTAGIVSALGRNYLGLNLFEDFIQTDAAINPGTGGALIDCGQSSASTARFSPRPEVRNGIASIPVSSRARYSSRSSTHGVTRGWLGIVPQPITRTSRRRWRCPPSVMIRGMQRGGPAEHAGILVRDVVVDVDGKPTHSVPQLLARIAELRPGSSARVRLVRDGKPVDVDVTVGKRPKPAEQ
jgi:serine protease DegQ